MNIENIKNKVSVFLEQHPNNYVNKIDAIRDDLVGMKIYDSPIFAVGNAHDPMFKELKNEDVIGEKYKIPDEWLSQANTVISYFLPYTDRVNRANASNMSIAIDEWYHARIEGQEMMAAVGDYIAKLLEEEGCKSIVPSSHKDFKMISDFNANWSERHAGYICGIGTFSIAKGMITKIGTSGRFGSVISSAELDITKRDYTKLYEYCLLCGACARNCPANCIDMTKSLHEIKDHHLCEVFCDSTNKIFICGGKEKLRYGCGKCQVNVPCEKRRASKLD